MATEPNERPEQGKWLPVHRGRCDPVPTTGRTPADELLVVRRTGGSAVVGIGASRARL